MRPIIALALLTAAIGCASGPRSPHAKYRAGCVPLAPPAPITASYWLHTAGTRVAVKHVEKGEIVGFVLNSDGSVSAVAPDFTLSLTPGSYCWEILPESVVEGPTHLRRGLSKVGDALGSLWLPLLLIGGAALYGIAASNSGR